jgi:hypothetical protein
MVFVGIPLPGAYLQRAHGPGSVHCGGLNTLRELRIYEAPDSLETIDGREEVF